MTRTRRLQKRRTRDRRRTSSAPGRQRTRVAAVVAGSRGRSAELNRYQLAVSLLAGLVIPGAALVLAGLVLGLADILCI